MKRALALLACAALLCPGPVSAAALRRAVAPPPRQAPASLAALPLLERTAVLSAGPAAGAATAAVQPAQASARADVQALAAQVSVSAEGGGDAAQPLSLAYDKSRPSASATAVNAAAATGLAAGMTALLAPAAMAMGHGTGSGVPSAVAKTGTSGVSDALGWTLIIGGLVAALLITRWIEGSVPVQHYLARRRWITDHNRKWAEADAETQAAVLKEAETIVARNKAGRATLKETAASMGRAAMFWRWPRYVRELKAERNAEMVKSVAAQVEKDRSAREKDDPKALKERIEAAGMTEEAKEAALSELRKLERTPRNHPEYGGRLDYIETLIELPWQKRTVDTIDLEDAQRVLDEDHYGLEDVKDRVIEYLAVRKLTGSLKGPILAFAGPPGVGKTSIAKDIARTTGRKFVRVSLGGVSDESEIRGHRRTYMGSLPGAIMSAIKKAGTKNPVLLLDEVDKLAESRAGQGNPKAALLELLDPEQNDAFRDRYLDVGFDMSEVLFIVTANVLANMPIELRDRLEIIEFSSYTLREKIEISKRHVLPEKLKANGLGEHKIEFTDAALQAVIEGYAHEAGVRKLGQEIDKLTRKIAAAKVRGTPVPARVDVDDVHRLLGVPMDLLGRTVDNGVGIASGLYYTSLGGGVTNTVVSVYHGKGQLRMRQQMGKSMHDSGANVVDYVRMKAKRFGIDPKLFGRVDISVAFTPATEIDGPSAGITMATALVSRLTGRAVKKGVAMTGELTPDGRVLPIGGLKEKVLGAHRMKYKKVFISRLNLKDVATIPAEVRAQVEIVPVDRVEDILDQALETEVSEPLDLDK